MSDKLLYEWWPSSAKGEDPFRGCERNLKGMQWM